MKTRKIDSLGLRLSIWYTLIMGALIVAAVLFLINRLREDEFRRIHLNAFMVADEVIEFWEKTRGTDWSDAIRFGEERFRALTPIMRVQGFNRKDIFQPKLVAQSTGAQKLPEFSRDVYQSLFHSREDHIDRTIKGTGDSRYPVHVLLSKAIHGSFIIEVGLPLKPVLLQMRRTAILLILGGIVLLFFTSLGGYLIIQRALLPVNRVVATVRTISADDLSLRIEPSPRRDEIGSLIDTFNDMITRLETSVSQIKQFSGDVSHELRTPLTVIRGEIEVMLRKKRRNEEYVRAMQIVMEQTVQMGKIIEDLLLLSRIEALKKKERIKEVDIGQLLTEIVMAQADKARDKGVRFSSDHLSSVLLKVDPVLFERLAVNLLDNAIRYTPEGGRIEISLREDSESILLTVADTGIGIPEESIPHIFDRFYVADPSRCKESGGVGLGLAIVKSVADLHGAAIEIDSQVNTGTTFRIRFPR